MSHNFLWWDHQFADQIFRQHSIERYAAAKPMQRPHILVTWRNFCRTLPLCAARYSVDVKLSFHLCRIQTSHKMFYLTATQYNKIWTACTALVREISRRSTVIGIQEVWNLRKYFFKIRKTWKEIRGKLLLGLFFNILIFFSFFRRFFENNRASLGSLPCPTIKIMNYWKMY